MNERIEVIIRVDYNLLLIQDPEDIRPFGVESEGERWFLQVEEDRVVIDAGQKGPVSVTIELLDSPPDEVDERWRETWEDVAARSFVTSTGDIVIGSVTSGREPDLDTLTPQGPGKYRIRVSAIGRITYWDAVAPDNEQPAVRLLLQLWASEPLPAILYQYIDRQTDRIVRADEQKPR